VVYGRESLIPGLRHYPMAAFVWNRRRGSARGIGEAEPLAANQIEINKTLARRLLNSKLTAYARPVYNAELIEDPAVKYDRQTGLDLSDQQANVYKQQLALAAQLAQYGDFSIYEQLGADTAALKEYFAGKNKA